jgi:DNA polymerase-3 subunit epsilon
MTPRRICVFDTETGGVGPEAAQKWSIIQLGACVYYDGLLPGLDTNFMVVIKEDFPNYDPEAMAINGFTQERIDAEGVSPSVAMLRFVLWIHKQFPDLLNGERVTLMGHNVGYDVSFLQRLFRLAGVLTAYDAFFSYRAIDTASIARFLIDAGRVPVQDAKSNSLFEHFDCAPYKPHDALSDAIATGNLYQKMLNVAAEPLISLPSITVLNPESFVRHPGDY